MLYDKYHGKTHAFVLQNDVSYCISEIEFRKQCNHNIIGNKLCYDCMR